MGKSEKKSSASKQSEKAEALKEMDQDAVELHSLTDSLNADPGKQYVVGLSLLYYTSFTSYVCCIPQLILFVVKLLLLVWTILGVENKDAKVLSVDKMGFEFELTNAKKETRVERYEFNDTEGSEPLVDAAAVRKEVTNLQSKSRIAVLPLNPSVFVTLLIWLIIMCGTSESEGVGSTYVQVLQFLAHKIFQSAANSRIALWVMIAAHLCEAIYAWSLLSRIKLDTFSKLSWGALILVFGFPVTSQVIFLHKYWQKQQLKVKDSGSKKNK